MSYKEAHGEGEGGERKQRDLFFCRGTDIYGMREAFHTVKLLINLIRPGQALTV